jgi:bla regulator protein blaR1
MIAFLIKSALSLGILLAIYYLALQREKMHGFKRFYLLFAVFFSIGIPFIEIQTTSENLPVPGLELISDIVENSKLEKRRTLENPMENGVGNPSKNPTADHLGNPSRNTTTDHFVNPSPNPTAKQLDNPGQHQPRNPISTTSILTYSIWTIYLSIGFLLLYRFIKNLWHLRCTIKRNPITHVGNAKLVLLNGSHIPHSFLNNIFLSKEDYENNKIEPELIQHELSHIQQKHSIDILLIEFASIVFWFNPLIFLYKKAIKLNHEFLADDAVLQNRQDVSTYQRILLSKIFMNKASGLASHVHYSLTKKRLIMMTKNTPFIRALALKLAMAPLFTFLLLFFCTKVLAQDPPPPKKEKQKENEKQETEKSPPLITLAAPWKNIKNQDSLRAIKEHYYSRRPEMIFGYKNSEGKFIKKRWSEMNQEEKDRMFPPPTPPTKMTITQAQMNAWADPKKYGVWIDGKRVKNEELSKYAPADFGHYFVSRLYKTALNYGKHEFQLNLMTVPAFDKWRKETLEDLGLPADE